MKGRTLHPIIEFSVDGDKYRVTGSAEGIPERTKDFVLDVEQEETTIDGRKVKVYCSYWPDFLYRHLIMLYSGVHRALTNVKPRD